MGYVKRAIWNWGSWVYWYGPENRLTLSRQDPGDSFLSNMDKNMSLTDSKCAVSFMGQGGLGGSKACQIPEYYKSGRDAGHPQHAPGTVCSAEGWSLALLSWRGSCCETHKRDALVRSQLNRDVDC
jgi:hypothetical protein